jgi:hypothetical protein
VTGGSSINTEIMRSKSMTTRTLLTIGLVTLSVSVSAQQPAPHAMTAMKPMTDTAKMKLAMSAGPADITKNAAVAEMDDKGTMRQLRAGTNGWTCMLLPTSKDVVLDAMCGDKAWEAWGDAYMAKKAPMTGTVGVAYMLQGDHGASNTDPYAMAPSGTNEWVVSPPHVMLLVPDMKTLDTLPTDPHAGGPWVMWKGSPYAHVMVPLSAVPMMTGGMKPMDKTMPMEKK